MEEKKPLGLPSLLSLGVNGIVGVGIFLAPPSVAAAVPGGAGAWLYLLVAAGCLPVALSYARLAHAHPVDGGPSLYADRAFGARVARAIGALVWVSALFSAAAVTRALGELLASTLRHPAWAPHFSVSLVVVLALVNLRGLRPSAIAWTILTVLKLAPLLGLAVLGAFLPASSPSPGLAADGAPGGRAVGAALLAILFAMQGFEVVPLPAGQAKDAERNVPLATVGSLVAAAALYALVHLACARALPALGSSRSAIPDAAAVLGGERLSQAVAWGVAASIAGIVVGMHAMTPRYLAAAYRRLREGPTILVSAAVIAPLVATSKVSRLISLSSVSVLAQYGSTALALLTLSMRRRDGLRPGDALPVPFALFVVVVLLSRAEWKELVVAAGIAGAGALLTLRGA